MNLKRTLNALGAVILNEAESNPDFAARLKEALDSREPAIDHGDTTRRPRSRNAAMFDPHALFAEVGEHALRARLSALSLDQLLDIVAEFVMDPSKLVMKWKRAERVADHIVETVQRRSVKGDAFRG